MSECNIDVISSKPILQAKLFSVEEYKIKLKNKREVIHTVAKRKPTITVFPLTDAHEVYLIHQYRYLLKATILEAVAGFINEGETPMQAAKRELKEETGIRAMSWGEIGRLGLSASVFKGETHIFLARDLELGIPEPEEDEDIELVKLPLEKAVEKIFTGEIAIASSVAGLLMVEKLLKKRK